MTLSTMKPALPEILYRSRDFLVIDKPAGMPVHAGPRGGASVEDFFPAFSRRRDGPWLAHRLDADTSGCLLIALRRAALVAAQAEFVAGRVRKTYWAIVQGGPAAESGVVRASLIKRTDRAGWRMVADPGGQEAETQWRVLARAEGMSWLELRPLTGRTHQIRVHCAELGCPLLGDPIYGSVQGKLQLLARSLDVEVAERIKVTAEPSAPMRKLLARFGAPGLPGHPVTRG